MTPTRVNQRFQIAGLLIILGAATAVLGKDPIPLAIGGAQFILGIIIAFATLLTGSKNR